jgi:hypothetical protein
LSVLDSSGHHDSLFPIAAARKAAIHGCVAVTRALRRQGPHGALVHIDEQHLDVPCSKLFASGDDGRADVVRMHLGEAQEQLAGGSLEWGRPLFGHTRTVERRCGFSYRPRH